MPLSSDLSLAPPTLLACAQSLLDILRQEFEILSRSDIAALDDLVKIKLQLFTELEHALNHDLNDADKTDIELPAIIDECLHQNTINGAFINVNRQHAELALSILRGQTLPTQLYDASGATSVDMTSNSLGSV